MNYITIKLLKKKKDEGPKLQEPSSSWPESCLSGGKGMPNVGTGWDPRWRNTLCSHRHPPAPLGAGPASPAGAQDAPLIDTSLWASELPFPLHPGRRVGTWAIGLWGTVNLGKLLASAAGWVGEARRKTRTKCPKKPWSRWPVATCCPASKLPFPSVQGNDAGQS